MRTLSAGLGAWLEQHPPGTPRVYADANMPAGLVRFLRQSLQWDVFFVMEHDDLRRAPDTEHFRLARQMHRTLLTLDRDYFDDQRFPRAHSGGVVVLSAPDERQMVVLLKRVERRLRAAGPGQATLPLEGQKIDLHPEVAPARRRRPRRP